MLIFHLDPDPNARELFQETVNLLNGVQLEQFSSIKACLAAAREEKKPGMFFCPLVLQSGDAITVRDEILAIHPDIRCVFLTFTADKEAEASFDTPCVPLSDRAGIVELIAGYPLELPEPDPVFQPGSMLGDYMLKERRSLNGVEEIYDAHQRTTSRPAWIHALRPEGLLDPDILRAFRSLVRARASVSQKNITVVYDASDSQNRAYFASEPLSQPTLDVVDPKVMTEKNLVLVVDSAAHAAHYLETHGLQWVPWTEQDISIDASTSMVKLANTVLPQPSAFPPVSPAESIATLGHALERFPHRGRFAPVLAQMSSGGVESWENLLGLATEHLNRLRNQSSLNRVETSLLPPAQRTKRKALTFALLAMLVGGTAFAIYNMRPSTTKLTVDSNMVFFRGGEFKGQDGKSSYMSGFYIDTRETAVGEYAEFLAALAKEPTTKFDHVSQPASKTSHVPKNWEAIYSAARDGKIYQGQRLSLNDPVVFVDFWDAHAYAAWKGRRLPTEAEWSRAARGEESRRFPWTEPDAPVPANANLGGDYKADGSGGQIDGYNNWAPVDGCPKDFTESGLFHTLGNVEEWTATLAEDPTFAGQFTAVVRGGNFTSPADTDLSVRKPGAKAGESMAWRGFRTASDTAPPK